MVDELKKLVEEQFKMGVSLDRDIQIIDESIVTFMSFYEDMLNGHFGEWTVFRGREHIGGFFSTHAEARGAGLERFGNVAMLVRQVTDEYKIYGKYGKPEVIPEKYLPKKKTH